MVKWSSETNYSELQSSMTKFWAGHEIDKKLHCDLDFWASSMVSECDTSWCYDGLFSQIFSYSFIHGKVKSPHTNSHTHIKTHGRCQTSVQTNSNSVICIVFNYLYIYRLCNSINYAIQPYTFIGKKDWIQSKTTSSHAFWAA